MYHWQSALLVLLNGHLWPGALALPKPQYVPDALHFLNCECSSPNYNKQRLTISRIGDYGENEGPVGGVSPPIPTVTSSSGSLRGDSSLLGGNAPLPNPEQSDSAIVPHPQLVNGQGAGAELGLYLDFDSADPPQPIRGENGNTDPGPRT